MKIKEITGTSTFTWSSDVLPLLATGSAAGAIDLNFSALSRLELWDLFGHDSHLPIFSAKLDDKFCALAWLRPFEGHRRGVLVGAMETGELQFWDAELLISTKSLSSALIHTSTKHTGAVKSLQFNPSQPHVLATGGQQGEIYIWDIRTFADPFAPGRAMTTMDEISCVSWNNAVSHILATTSNGGFTSIWDLKSKREVLHLSYNGPLGRADFSYVAWHPLQLTKLATASQNDGCPLVMTWDLRNASEPEKILQGHSKGVLSLDWCIQDPELMISSGKDNSTILWNPIAGIKLGQYPVAANWTFLTKFAPKAPDVIATASFDGKIVVQTLQDTSPPISEQVKATDDNDFWSNIASTETQRAEFEVKQPPLWLKRPCGVSFGFGSKIVVLKSENGRSTVSVTKLTTDSHSSDFAHKLYSAVQSNDYTAIIDGKLKDGVRDHSDWEVLKQLSQHGKGHLFQNLVEGSEVKQNGPSISNGLELKDDNLEDLGDFNETSFFQNLANDIKGQKDKGFVFVPSGEFKILDDNQSPVDASLARLILSNKIEEAVTVCLKEDKLLEALILSLDESASVKAHVKDHYFKNHLGDVLSRLIYSASSRDVLDIVSNADISNWKEIASSISAYSKDEADFNSKIVELGDRIFASGSNVMENRDKALKCYLAGGALDKVCSIWLRELPALEEALLKALGGEVSSPFDARWSALGSFVEKLAVYKSISHISGPLSGPAIEPVCKAVFEFSNMAATGGHFELANQFLSLLPDDFAGLKAEKERISTALESSTHQEPAKGNYARKKSAFTPNGSKPGRYTNNRVTPRSSPQREFLSMAPPSTAMRNSLSASVPSNPYVPSGNSILAPAALVNPYTPAPSEPISNPLISTVNHLAPGMLAGPTGSVRPPATPTIATPFAPLSTQYGASIRQSSAVSSPPPPKPSYKVETDGWNDLPDTFKARKPARRAAASPAVALASPLTKSSPTQSQKPNVSSPVIRPPPKLGSRASSKTSVSITPTNSRNVLASNKYAPPPGSSPIQPPNGASGHKQLNMSTSISNVPPKNPYAPNTATANPTKVSYAPPPANSFAPPASLSRSSTNVQTTNPYAPNVNTNVAPPVTSPMLQPPTKQGGQSSSPRPPVSGPQRTSQPTGQIPPPPKSKFPNSRVSSPQVSAPPLNPRPISRPPSRPSTTGPPVLAPPPVSAPPKLNQIGSPRLSPQIAPPPSRPLRIARTASISSLTLHLAASYPAAGGDRSQIPETTKPIFTTFTKYLEEIKPAAPAKYAKHVTDMEKRLNILFDHLNQQNVLSEDTINSLINVASLLESKNYGGAASANNEILAQHANEVGAWHTGVKRLITMAEAFDS